MAPKISIIIPTYKPLELFRNTLESIALQIFQDYELLIILNGCNEPFYDNITKWVIELNLCSKTQIIHTPISGVSNARNLGIDKCKGEYVCFIDDDDIVSPDYLSGMISQCDGDSVSVIFSNVLTFKNDISFSTDDNIYHRAYSSLLKNAAKNLYDVRRLLNGPWGKLYNHKILGNIRFNESIKNGEDALFNFKISSYISKIICASPTSIYYYRIRAESVTRKNQSPVYLIKNALILNKIYSCIFFKHIGKYGFLLYLSRIAATWKFVILRIKNK